MKTSTVSLVMLLVPAALCAQVGGQAAASASAQATADVRVPASFSAEGQAKLSAMYAEAKEHHVPREPMYHRVAEGRAKGASEASIIASTGKVKANLEATQSAMVSAGRMHPSDEEMERGESAMERGVTKAQITAIAKSSQGDRSLVVAFDVLAKLAARGVPVGQAVAQVQANVTSGASDATLAALVTASGGAAGNANGANAGANATGNAAAANRPLTGTVTTAVGGTVGAVVKKP